MRNRLTESYAGFVCTADALLWPTQIRLFVYAFLSLRFATVFIDAGLISYLGVVSLYCAVGGISQTHAMFVLALALCFVLPCSVARLCVLLDMLHFTWALRIVFGPASLRIWAPCWHFSCILH